MLNLQGMKRSHENIALTPAEVKAPPIVMNEEVKGVKRYTRERVQERFPVPEKFFEHPAHRVLFDCASDILCGDEMNTSADDVEYAERFLAMLTAKEETEDNDFLAHEAALRHDADPALTSAMKATLFDFGPESKLHAQREAMGIESKEDEKPYDVVVVKSPNDAKHRDQQRKAWEQRTHSPTQFMIRSAKEGYVPTIFMSDFDAREILGDDKYRGIDMTAHEYRHTQRSFAFAHDRLFRLIDEVATNVTGYGKENALLEILSLTTSDIPRRAYKAAYDTGDAQAQANLLARLAENVGKKGILLIGGRKSSEHSGDNDGLRELPLVEMEEGASENVRFAESLLRLRAEQTPNYLDTFRERIHDPAIERRTLEAWCGMYAITWTPKNGAVGHMTEIRDAMKAEIERRALLGEKSLYDR